MYLIVATRAEGGLVLASHMAILISFVLECYIMLKDVPEPFYISYRVSQKIIHRFSSFYKMSHSWNLAKLYGYDSPVFKVLIDDVSYIPF